jgi:hypothetical protein
MRAVVARVALALALVGCAFAASFACGDRHCQLDEDCPQGSGYHCDYGMGQCVQGCSQDSDCEFGHCDVSNGMCSAHGPITLPTIDADVLDARTSSTSTRTDAGPGSGPG